MKFGQKSKLGNGAAIILGVVAMLLALLIGAWAAAAMLHSGRISEAAATITTIVIRVVATMIAATVTWLLSPQTPLRNTVIAVSVSTAVLLILAMLFWQIDIPGIFTGIGITGGVVLVWGYIFSRRKSGRAGGIKKVNIVKMYKNTR